MDPQLPENDHPIQRPRRHRTITIIKRLFYLTVVYYLLSLFMLAICYCLLSSWIGMLHLSWKHGLVWVIAGAACSYFLYVVLHFLDV